MYRQLSQWAKITRGAFGIPILTVGIFLNISFAFDHNLSIVKNNKKDLDIKLFHWQIWDGALVTLEAFVSISKMSPKHFPSIPHKCILFVPVRDNDILLHSKSPPTSLFFLRSSHITNKNFFGACHKINILSIQKDFPSLSHLSAEQSSPSDHISWHYKEYIEWWWWDDDDGNFWE